MVTTNPFTTAKYVEAVEALEKETETVINRLMSDLKAAQDLSAYLAANNKKLREALNKIVELDGYAADGYEYHKLAIKIARAALKEGE